MPSFYYLKHRFISFSFSKCDIKTNVVHFIFKLERHTRDKEVTPNSFPMKTLTFSLKDYV